jgi:selenide,water dikinase
MLDWTTRLNTPGELLAELPGVHALTDVTGFGLAGHLLEMCRGSGLAASLEFSAIPLIEEAVAHAQAGIATGASDRNWNGYGHEIEMPDSFPAWKHKILTDPQTSGGLLVSCHADAVQQVLKVFSEKGFAVARPIGRLAAGPARITVA